MNQSYNTIFSVGYRLFKSMCLLPMFLISSLAIAKDNIAFDVMCAMAMSMGRPTKTDCSITWQDDSGQSYCFGTEGSKTQFLENPEFNLVRANEYFSMSDTQVLSKRMQCYCSKDVKKFLKEYIRTKTAANGCVSAL